jgi:hypothetical protein
MIDEAIRPELEQLLRATLDEMIPKVVAARPPNIVTDIADLSSASVGPARSRHSVRRLVVAMSVAAAVVVGLVGVVNRDADQRNGASGSTAEPEWYRLLHPALPEHFERAALTLATDTQMWFVAMDERDGKALEIQVGLDNEFSSDKPTSTDSTGTWYAKPQGLTVVKPDGLQVTVTCDIGAKGRDFPGPPNYCDMASTGPFTESDIRVVATRVASTFDKSVFSARLGTPMPVTNNPAHIATLIAAAVPDQQHHVGSTDWGPGDEIFDFSIDGVRPDTSVRLVEGVYPPPTTTEPARYGLYDDAAAFWVVTPGGAAVRISTTNTLPESLDRLDQLAFEILGSVAPLSTTVFTTTTFVSADTIAVDDGSVDQPTTYYPTDSPMPMWPDVATSGETPIGHIGYGMALCSGGSWTTFTSLASATGIEQSYQGTLCAFSTFPHPIPETVASCSSMSPGTNYARCQERYDTTFDPESGQPDGTGPPSVQQSVAVQLLPPTPEVVPQVFGDRVSALSGPSGPAYIDDAVSVVFHAGDSPDQTCFVIRLTDLGSSGCVDSTLLKTGLAYGAYEAKDGPIEVVGIVPDDVASVEIVGRVISVKNNVWHYTGQPGDDLSFTVRSADGTLSASVG